MLRSLLEERFSLKTHNETREIDVYGLTLDRADKKLGPKVKPWGGTCVSGKAPRPDGDPTMPRCTAAFRAPGLVSEGVTMIPVAEMLSTQRALLGRIVQDREWICRAVQYRTRIRLSGRESAGLYWPLDLHRVERAAGLEARSIERAACGACSGERQPAGREFTRICDTNTAPSFFRPPVG